MNKMEATFRAKSNAGIIKMQETNTRTKAEKEARLADMLEIIKEGGINRVVLFERMNLIKSVTDHTIGVYIKDLKDRDQVYVLKYIDHPDDEKTITDRIIRTPVYAVGEAIDKASVSESIRSVGRPRQWAKQYPCEVHSHFFGVTKQYLRDFEHQYYTGVQA